MKEFLKNKSTGFCVGLVGGVLGLITLILYTVYSVSVGHFAVEVFAMLLLGVCSSAFAAAVKFEWAPLLPVLFFSLAFGLYINDRVIMFEEMINRIYPMNAAPGAILPVVIAILVLNLVSAIMCVFASFTSREKEAT